jgi:hypothetical protein
MFSELLRVLKLDPGILRYIKSRSNPITETLQCLKRLVFVIEILGLEPSILLQLTHSYERPVKDLFIIL